MCGIVGYIGPRMALPLLIEGLRRLEYRGYDSAGVAIAAAGGLTGAMVDFAKIAAAFSTTSVLSSANVDLMLNNRYGFDAVVSPLKAFKGGQLAGTASHFEVAKNDFSISVAFNRELVGGSFANLWTAIMNEPAATWTGVNDFDRYGLPD